jgi:hypothetical protein
MKIKVRNATLNISTGNSKMGKVYSFSTLPIITCEIGVPCYRDCYARKLAILRPVLRKTWEENTEAVKTVSKREIVKAITSYIRTFNVQLFRWNVSGDFRLPGYWEITTEVAQKSPECRFMAFTKCYWLAQKKRPENFNLILSAWKALTPKSRNCGIAYFNDGTYPIPTNAKECGGDCESCQKCFFLKAGEAVVFKKH